MKALQMLKNGKSTKERAERYVKTSKEDIFEEVLKPLEREILAIDDKLFELEDFDIETNLNQGKVRMDSNQVKARFKEMINLKYKKQMLELELKVKTSCYEELFL